MHKFMSVLMAKHIYLLLSYELTSYPGGTPVSLTNRRLKTPNLPRYSLHNVRPTESTQCSSGYNQAVGFYDQSVLDMSVANLNS